MKGWHFYAVAISMHFLFSCSIKEHINKLGVASLSITDFSFSPRQFTCYELNLMIWCYFVSIFIDYINIDHLIITKMITIDYQWLLGYWCKDVIEVNVIIITIN